MQVIINELAYQYHFNNSSNYFKQITKNFAQVPQNGICLGWHGLKGLSYLGAGTLFFKEAAGYIITTYAAANPFLGMFSTGAMGFANKALDFAFKTLTLYPSHCFYGTLSAFFMSDYKNVYNILKDMYNITNNALLSPPYNIINGTIEFAKGAKEYIKNPEKVNSSAVYDLKEGEDDQIIIDKVGENPDISSM